MCKLSAYKEITCKTPRQFTYKETLDNNAHKLTLPYITWGQFIYKETLDNNAQAELTTVRIKRLLELISSYSFNLYYIKGKDMVLSDFLSRQNNDDSNPHEIILISFNMHKVLHENYLVQRRFQARSSGIKLLEVHGVRRNLDPNIKPEKQHVNPIKGSIVKPHIG